MQAGFGGPYNADSSRLILSEVMKEHGQQAVDELIVGLDRIRVQAGTRFEGGLALPPGESNLFSQ